MKIGVDAHLLGKGKGGVERYVAELCSRLPHVCPTDTFYFFVEKSYIPVEHPANVHWVRLIFSDPLIQRSLILPWFIWKLNLDLIHTQRIAPLFANCPVVVSVHDILPLTVPDNYPGLRHGLIRFLTGWTVKKAHTVLTVSQNSKSEIKKELPSRNGTVESIYNGVDHDFFKPYSGFTNRPVKEDYIFYAGAIEPRKNLETVLEAYVEICSHHGNNLSLVLTGMDRDKAYARKLRSQARSIKKTSKIIFTGFLSEEQYLQYLQNASIFLAPSKGEGFDLPPLEAMACQVPVICSDIGVHRELFDGSALFFQATSHQELAKTILDLYSNPRLANKLKEQGANCATRFSWEKTICQIAKIYQEIGQSKKG